MRWELAIIERFTVGLMIGFSYYPKEDEKDFTECLYLKKNLTKNNLIL